MRIEIWSDVVCPWCYIGKRRFEAALAEFEHADEVEVTWRSFELDPRASRGGEADLVKRLAVKYGVPTAQAEGMLERVTRIAEDEGLRYRLDIARHGNTFDAHRVLHLAAERGVQDAVKERLLAAYQCEGRAIADHDVLVEAAVAGGLDQDEVREVLASDRFGAEVRADEAEAMDLGVTGVPFFVFDRRFAVSGAQDPDTILHTLRRAWGSRAPLQVLAGDDACGPDGCEVP